MAGFRTPIPTAVLNYGGNRIPAGFMHVVPVLGLSMAGGAPKSKPFDLFHDARARLLAEDEELLIFIQAFMQCR